MLHTHLALAGTRLTYYYYYYAGQRLYTFGGTDGGHKFNEVCKRLQLHTCINVSLDADTDCLQLHELDLETFNWSQLAVNGTPPAPR